MSLFFPIRIKLIPLVYYLKGFLMTGIMYERWISRYKNNNNNN